MAKSKDLALMSDFKDRMKADLVQDVSREVSSGGMYISTEGFKFSLGEDIMPDALNVVILDYVFENADYGDAVYDKENPQPPVCSAVADEEKDLIPSEDSIDKQADSCEECPLNRYKSADNNKGKHCKNRRRLALMDADHEDPTDAPVLLLKIPPTGLVNWKKYRSELENVRKIMPYGCVTRITMDKTFDNPIVKFEFVAEVENPVLGNAILDNRDKISEDLRAAVDVTFDNDDDDDKPKSKKKTGKKKVSKKKEAVKKEAPKKVPTRKTKY